MGFLDQNSEINPINIKASLVAGDELSVHESGYPRADYQNAIWLAG